MLIVNGFGFVYKHTGDAAYLYRGDLVFAGGVEEGWLEGSKQFNQQYATSYKYLAYAHSELSLQSPAQADASATIEAACAGRPRRRASYRSAQRSCPNTGR